MDQHLKEKEEFIKETVALRSQVKEAIQQKVDNDKLLTQQIAEAALSSNKLESQSAKVLMVQENKLAVCKELAISLTQEKEECYDYFSQFKDQQQLNNLISPDTSAAAVFPATVGNVYVPPKPKKVVISDQFDPYEPLIISVTKPVEVVETQKK